MKHYFRKSFVLPVILILFSLTLFSGCTGSPEMLTDTRETGESPVEAYGDLQVLDGKICAENGMPVQLKGMSTMGLQWYGEVVNPDAFDALTYDWECDVIRLALYVGENGYASRPDLKDLVHKGVQLAIERGIYVIIDWHVLTPGDPNDSIYKDAENFFMEMSQTYRNYPNVIYEIMNEPNGSLSWRTDLKPYAQKMVDIIRREDPDNLILIGSGHWSQDLHIAAADPVEGKNLAYTVHFYSGTHGESLRSNVLSAMRQGQAVFCSEWGTSKATGDGGPYLDQAEAWLDFFDENDIGWVNWSLATKNETSAAFNALLTQYQEGKGTVTIQEEAPLRPEELHSDGYKYWPEEQLSASGAWVRARIKGIDPPELRKENTLVQEAPAADQGIFAGLPWNFETGNLQGWSVTADSPVKVALNLHDAESSAMGFAYAWETPGPPDTWSVAPRLTSSNVNLRGSLYEALSFDFYYNRDALTKGSIEVQPIIQSPQHGYWYQMKSYKVSTGEGEPVGDNLMKVSIEVPLNQGGNTLKPDAVLRNLILITIGAGADYEGVILYDNITFK